MEKELNNQSIPKAATGIKGFDDITFGGLPGNRTTLLSGYAGCGKTVFSMFFILNGIVEFDEPGVFLTLEENEADLKKNFASFGYDVEKLQKEGKLVLESINVNKPELHSAGSFDLTALLVRIEQAIKQNNAKRLVIDTFELLFYDINDGHIFRKELLRLINWLKQKGITAVFTAEMRNDGISRYGLEEFITDCVVVLKNLKSNNIYTRRLHIVKYRGNFHGTNEYPFLIDRTGVTLMPITNIKMPLKVTTEVLSCGIPSLDEKLEKKGIYKGTSNLVTGTSGNGKSSLAVSFAYRGLLEGKNCLFFAFEESAAQLKRNMGNLGMDLEKFENKGSLYIYSDRPSVAGLEMHLVSILKKVEEKKPEIIVFDPITTLIEAGSPLEVRNMLLRLMDYLKSLEITIMITSLINSSLNSINELGISSLVDNIITLGNTQRNSHLEHTIYIEKIRGMAYERKHFLLKFTSEGLKVEDMDHS